MKLIFSLCIIFSFFITFGRVVPSTSHQESSASQAISWEDIMNDFSDFLYGQVITSPNMYCKRTLTSTFMQTQMGRLVDEIFSILMGVPLTELLDVMIYSLSPAEVLQDLTETLYNASVKNITKIETVGSDFEAQVSQTGVQSITQEFDEIQTVWRTCLSENSANNPF